DLRVSSGPQRTWGAFGHGVTTRSPSRSIFLLMTLNASLMPSTSDVPSSPIRNRVRTSTALRRPDTPVVEISTSSRFVLLRHGRVLRLLPPPPQRPGRCPVFVMVAGLRLLHLACISGGRPTWLAAAAQNIVPNMISSDRGRFGLLPSRTITHLGEDAPTRSTMTNILAASGDGTKAPSPRNCP